MHIASHLSLSVQQMLKARALKASSSQTNNQLVVKSTSYVPANIYCIYPLFCINSIIMLPKSAL